MNALAAVALVLAGTIAVADWTAKSRGAAAVRRVTKPGAIVALIVAASVVDPVVADQRPWVLAALGAGLVGDVALLRASTRSMVAGAVAFAVGHGCYVVGFGLRDAGATVPVAVVAVAVLAVWAVPAALRRARQRSAGLAAAVVAYLLVLAGLLAGAILAGGRVAVLGATLFAMSDLALLRDRFVGGVAGLGVAATAGYHAAQGLLVVSLVA